MRIPRIYHPASLGEGETVTLRKAAIKHAVTVLRLRPGAPLTLFDGQGNAYQAELTKQGEARVKKPLSGSSESPLALHLIQAIARGERMDFIIQKAVELGVSEITPVLSERCVVKLKGERTTRRLQHWQEIIIGACEQSGCNRLPVLSRVTPLDRVLTGSSGGLNLLLDPAAERGAGDLPRPAGKISLVIGPEGGFSESEIGLARRAGFTSLRLGPRILRTETAALAAVSALQTLWGDFGR